MQKDSCTDMHDETFLRFSPPPPPSTSLRPERGKSLQEIGVLSSPAGRTCLSSQCEAAKASLYPRLRKCRAAVLPLFLLLLLLPAGFATAQTGAVLRLELLSETPLSPGSDVRVGVSASRAPGEQGTVVVAATRPAGERRLLRTAAVILPASGATVTAVFRADGRNGLSPGVWTLTARANAAVGRAVPITVQVPVLGLSLERLGPAEVAAGTAVRVRVATAVTPPPEGIPLTVNALQGGRESVQIQGFLRQSGPSQELTFSGLSPGRWRLMVEAEQLDTENATDTVTVRPLLLTLEPAVPVVPASAPAVLTLAGEVPPGVDLALLVIASSEGRSDVTEPVLLEAEMLSARVEFSPGRLAFGRWTVRLSVSLDTELADTSAIASLTVALPQLRLEPEAEEISPGEALEVLVLSEADLSSRLALRVRARQYDLEKSAQLQLEAGTRAGRAVFRAEDDNALGIGPWLLSIDPAEQANTDRAQAGVKVRAFLQRFSPEQVGEEVYVRLETAFILERALRIEVTANSEGRLHSSQVIVEPTLSTATMQFSALFAEGALDPGVWVFSVSAISPPGLIELPQPKTLRVALRTLVLAPVQEGGRVRVGIAASSGLLTRDASITVEARQGDTTHTRTTVLAASSLATEVIFERGVLSSGIWTFRVISALDLFHSDPAELDIEVPTLTLQPMQEGIRVLVRVAASSVPGEDVSITVEARQGDTTHTRTTVLTASSLSTEAVFEGGVLSTGTWTFRIVSSSPADLFLSAPVTLPVEALTLTLQGAVQEGIFVRAQLTASEMPGEDISIQVQARRENITLAETVLLRADSNSADVLFTSLQLSRGEWEFSVPEVPHPGLLIGPEPTRLLLTATTLELLPEQFGVRVQIRVSLSANPRAAIPIGVLVRQGATTFVQTVQLGDSSVADARLAPGQLSSGEWEFSVLEDSRPRLLVGPASAIPDAATLTVNSLTLGLMAEQEGLRVRVRVTADRVPGADTSITVQARQGDTTHVQTVLLASASTSAEAVFDRGLLSPGDWEFTVPVVPYPGLLIGPESATLTVNLLTLNLMPEQEEFRVRVRVTADQAPGVDTSITVRARQVGTTHLQTVLLAGASTSAEVVFAGETELSLGEWTLEVERASLLLADFFNVSAVNFTVMSFTPGLALAPVQESSLVRVLLTPVARRNRDVSITLEAQQGSEIRSETVALAASQPSAEVFFRGLSAGNWRFSLAETEPPGVFSASPAELEVKAFLDLMAAQGEISAGEPLGLVQTDIYCRALSSCPESRQSESVPGTSFGFLEGVAVSPDGRMVVASGDNSLQVWRLDSAAGTLEDHQTFVDDVDSIDGLGGARFMVFSGDSRLLFVTAGGDDSISVWRVNTQESTLSLSQVYKNGQEIPEGLPTGDQRRIGGLAGAWGVAVSPDGRLLFVTGLSNNALSVWRIDAAAAALQEVALYCESSGCPGGSGEFGDVLRGARALTSSPDGRFVFVEAFAGDQLGVWQVRADDTLDLVQRFSNGAFLDEPIEVAVSPEGKHLFTSANRSSALGILRIAEDGTVSEENFYNDIRRSDVSCGDQNLNCNGYSNLHGVDASPVPGDNLIYTAEISDQNHIGIRLLDPEGGMLIRSSLAQGFRDSGSSDVLNGLRYTAVSPGGGLLMVTARPAAVGALLVLQAQGIRRMASGSAVPVSVSLSNPVPREVAVTVTARQGARAEPARITLSPGQTEGIAEFGPGRLSLGEWVFTASAEESIVRSSQARTSVRMDEPVLRLSVSSQPLNAPVPVQLERAMPGSIDAMLMVIATPSGGGSAEAVSVPLAADERMAMVEFPAGVLERTNSWVLTVRAEPSHAVRGEEAISEALTLLPRAPALMLTSRQQRYALGAPVTLELGTGVPITVDNAEVSIGATGPNGEDIVPVSVTLRPSTTLVVVRVPGLSAAGSWTFMATVTPPDALLGNEVQVSVEVTTPTVTLSLADGEAGLYLPGQQVRLIAELDVPLGPFQIIAIHEDGTEREISIDAENGGSDSFEINFANERALDQPGMWSFTVRASAVPILNVVPDSLSVELLANPIGASLMLLSDTIGPGGFTLMVNLDAPAPIPIELILEVTDSFGIRFGFDLGIRGFGLPISVGEGAMSVTVDNYRLSGVGTYTFRVRDQGIITVTEGSSLSLAVVASELLLRVDPDNPMQASVFATPHQDREISVTVRAIWDANLPGDNAQREVSLVLASRQSSQRVRFEGENALSPGRWSLDISAIQTLGEAFSNQSTVQLTVGPSLLGLAVPVQELSVGMAVSIEVSSELAQGVALSIRVEGEAAGRAPVERIAVLAPNQRFARVVFEAGVLRRGLWRFRITEVLPAALMAEGETFPVAVSGSSVSLTVTGPVLRLEPPVSVGVVGQDVPIGLVTDTVPEDRLRITIIAVRRMDGGSVTRQTVVEFSEERAAAIFEADGANALLAGLWTLRAEVSPPGAADVSSAVATILVRGTALRLERLGPAQVEEAGTPVRVRLTADLLPLSGLLPVAVIASRIGREVRRSALLEGAESVEAVFEEGLLSPGEWLLRGVTEPPGRLFTGGAIDSVTVGGIRLELRPVQREFAAADAVALTLTGGAPPGVEVEVRVEVTLLVTQVVASSGTLTFGAEEKSLDIEYSPADLAPGIYRVVARVLDREELFLQASVETTLTIALPPLPRLRLAPERNEVAPGMPVRLRVFSEQPLQQNISVTVLAEQGNVTLTQIVRLGPSMSSAGVAFMLGGMGEEAISGLWRFSVLGAEPAGNVDISDAGATVVVRGTRLSFMPMRIRLENGQPARVQMAADSPPPRDVQITVTATLADLSASPSSVHRSALLPAAATTASVEFPWEDLAVPGATWILTMSAVSDAFVQGWSATGRIEFSPTLRLSFMPPNIQVANGQPARVQIAADSPPPRDVQLTVTATLADLSASPSSVHRSVLLPAAATTAVAVFPWEDLAVPGGIWDLTMTAPDSFVQVADAAGRIEFLPRLELNIPSPYWPLSQVIVALSITPTLNTPSRVQLIATHEASGRTRTMTVDDFRSGESILFEPLETTGTWIFTAQGTRAEARVEVVPPLVRLEADRQFYIQSPTILLNIDWTANGHFVRLVRNNNGSVGARDFWEAELTNLSTQPTHTDRVTIFNYLEVEIPENSTAGSAATLLENLGFQNSMVMEELLLGEWQFSSVRLENRTGGNDFTIELENPEDRFYVYDNTLTGAISAGAESVAPGEDVQLTVTLSALPPAALPVRVQVTDPAGRVLEPPEIVVVADATTMTVSSYTLGAAGTWTFEITNVPGDVNARRATVTVTPGAEIRLDLSPQAEQPVPAGSALPLRVLALPAPQTDLRVTVQATRGDVPSSLVTERITLMLDGRSTSSESLFAGGLLSSGPWLLTITEVEPAGLVMVASTELRVIIGPSSLRLSAAAAVPLGTDLDIHVHLNAPLREELRVVAEGRLENGSTDISTSTVVIQPGLLVARGTFNAADLSRGMWYFRILDVSSSTLTTEIGDFPLASFSTEQVMTDVGGAPNVLQLSVPEPEVTLGSIVRVQVDLLGVLAQGSSLHVTVSGMPADGAGEPVNQAVMLMPGASTATVEFAAEDLGVGIWNFQITDVEVMGSAPLPDFSTASVSLRIREVLPPALRLKRLGPARVAAGTIVSVEVSLPSQRPSERAELRVAAIQPGYRDIVLTGLLNGAGVMRLSFPSLPPGGWILTAMVEQPVEVLMEQAVSAVFVEPAPLTLTAVRPTVAAGAPLVFTLSSPIPLGVDTTISLTIQPPNSAQEDNIFGRLPADQLSVSVVYVYTPTISASTLGIWSARISDVSDESAAFAVQTAAAVRVETVLGLSLAKERFTELEDVVVSAVLSPVPVGEPWSFVLTVENKVTDPPSLTTTSLTFGMDDETAEVTFGPGDLGVEEGDRLLTASLARLASGGGEPPVSLEGATATLTIARPTLSLSSLYPVHLTGESPTLHVLSSVVQGGEPLEVTVERTFAGDLTATTPTDTVSMTTMIMPGEGSSTLTFAAFPARGLHTFTATAEVDLVVASEPIQVYVVDEPIGGISIRINPDDSVLKPGDELTIRAMATNPLPVDISVALDLESAPELSAEVASALGIPAAAAGTVLRIPIGAGQNEGSVFYRLQAPAGEWVFALSNDPASERLSITPLGDDARQTVERPFLVLDPSDRRIPRGDPIPLLVKVQRSELDPAPAVPYVPLEGFIGLDRMELRTTQDAADEGISRLVDYRVEALSTSTLIFETGFSRLISVSAFIDSVSDNTAVVSDGTVVYEILAPRLDLSATMSQVATGMPVELQVRATDAPFDPTTVMIAATQLNRAPVTVMVPLTDASAVAMFAGLLTGPWNFAITGAALLPSAVFPDNGAIDFSTEGVTVTVGPPLITLEPSASSVPFGEDLALGITASQVPGEDVAVQLMATGAPGGTTRTMVAAATLSAADTTAAAVFATGQNGLLPGLWTFTATTDLPLPVRVQPRTATVVAPTLQLELVYRGDAPLPAGETAVLQLRASTTPVLAVPLSVQGRRSDGEERRIAVMLTDRLQDVEFPALFPGVWTFSLVESPAEIEIVGDTQTITVGVSALQLRPEQAVVQPGQPVRFSLSGAEPFGALLNLRITARPVPAAPSSVQPIIVSMGARSTSTRGQFPAGALGPGTWMLSGETIPPGTVPILSGQVRLGIPGLELTAEQKGQTVLVTLRAEAPPYRAVMVQVQALLLPDMGRRERGAVMLSGETAPIEFSAAAGNALEPGRWLLKATVTPGGVVRAAAAIEFVVLPDLTLTLLSPSRASAGSEVQLQAAVRGELAESTTLTIVAAEAGRESVLRMVSLPAGMVPTANLVFAGGMLAAGSWTFTAMPSSALNTAAARSSVLLEPLNLTLELASGHSPIFAPGEDVVLALGLRPALPVAITLTVSAALEGSGSAELPAAQTLSLSPGTSMAESTFSGADLTAGLWRFTALGGSGLLDDSGAELKVLVTGDMLAITLEVQQEAFPGEQVPVTASARLGTGLLGLALRVEIEAADSASDRVERLSILIGEESSSGSVDFIPDASVSTWLITIAGGDVPASTQTVETLRVTNLMPLDFSTPADGVNADDLVFMQRYLALCGGEDVVLQPADCPALSSEADLAVNFGPSSFRFDTLTGLRLPDITGDGRGGHQDIAVLLRALQNVADELLLPPGSSAEERQARAARLNIIRRLLGRE